LIRLSSVSNTPPGVISTLLPCCCLLPSHAALPHPTCCRDISKLSVFNILGVGAVMLLAAAAGLLGLTALITGVAHAPPVGEKAGGGCWGTAKLLVDWVNQQ
jgi:hypothetical protein